MAFLMHFSRQRILFSPPFATERSPRCELYYCNVNCALPDTVPQLIKSRSQLFFNRWWCNEKIKKGRTNKLRDIIAAWNYTFLEKPAASLLSFHANFLKLSVYSLIIHFSFSRETILRFVIISSWRNVISQQHRSASAENAPCLDPSGSNQCNCWWLVDRANWRRTSVNHEAAPISPQL